MRRYRKASVALITGISLTTLLSPLMTHAAQASTVKTVWPWTIYTVFKNNGNSNDYLVSINGETGAMESAIPFVATAPRTPLISPDRTRAYVISWNSFITVLDLTGNQPPSRIQLDARPQAMAIASDGKTAYVTVGQHVISVDLSSNQTQVLASLANTPYGIAVSPDGKTLYVATASTADNNTTTIQLVPVKIASKTSSAPINLGTSDEYSPPLSVNLSTDGNTAYVDAMQLEIVNLKSGDVKKVNMEMSGAGPMPKVVIDPLGRVLYALNPAENELSSLNLKTGDVNQVFANGDAQQGLTNDMAMTPDGSRLYVSATAVAWDTPKSYPLDGEIQIFSSSAFSTSRIAEIPHGPEIASLPHTEYPYVAGPLAVASDQAPHATFTVTRAPVGQATVFDASASYGDSPIKIYHWNFGDGTTSDSSTPIVNHTYHGVGSYKVTLTETDAVGATVNNPEVNAGSTTAQTSQTVRIQSVMFSGNVPPFGVAGRQYHAQLKVLGGTAPYLWHMVSGPLPSGLTFNSKTGLISGTPRHGGAWHVTISATDAHGVVISQKFPISIILSGLRMISVHGNPGVMPFQIQKDPVHKDLTTYIELNVIEGALGAFGIQASWNGKMLSLITPGTFTLSGGTKPGTHPYSIWINGEEVETFPAVVKPELFGGEPFLPLYYVMDALGHIQGLKTTWDGSTWSIT